MQLVTLDEVKRHLRINYSYDDEDLTLKINAASERIREYIDGDVDIKSNAIKNATLQLVRIMFDDREGISSVWQEGRLPVSVTAFLTTKRAVSIC